MYLQVKRALTGTAILAALPVSSISAHAITSISVRLYQEGGPQNMQVGQ